MDESLLSVTISPARDSGRSRRGSGRGGVAAGRLRTSTFTV